MRYLIEGKISFTEDRIALPEYVKDPDDVQLRQFNTPNPSLPQLQVVCILTGCSTVRSCRANISPSILTDFYLICAILWYMRWSRQLLKKSGWNPQTYRLHLKRHPNSLGGVWLYLRILLYHLFLRLNL